MEKIFVLRLSAALCNVSCCELGLKKHIGVVSKCYIFEFSGRTSSDPCRLTMQNNAQFEDLLRTFLGNNNERRKEAEEHYAGLREEQPNQLVQALVNTMINSNAVDVRIMLIICAASIFRWSGFSRISIRHTVSLAADFRPDRSLGLRHFSPVKKALCDK
jgi:hypothetical protein